MTCKIVNGKLYNTETARCYVESNAPSVMDFHRLYRTKDGDWFVWTKRYDGNGSYNTIEHLDGIDVVKRWLASIGEFEPLEQEDGSTILDLVSGGNS